MIKPTYRPLSAILATALLLASSALAWAQETDDFAARCQASRPVQWRDTKASKTPNAKIKLLAINDFHGQISSGQKISGHPVGSAPVLAAYLESAEIGIEDNTIILHTGDLVGASPADSALLQDEPSLMFFNMLGNRYCKTFFRMDPRNNIVGTVGNHEFDEGVPEMRRLIYGGNHAKGPFLEDHWKGAAFPYVCANVVNNSLLNRIYGWILVRVGVQVGDRERFR